MSNERFGLDDAFEMCLRTKGMMTATGKYTKQQVWNFKNANVSDEKKREVVLACGFVRVQQELWIKK